MPSAKINFIPTSLEQAKVSLSFCKNRILPTAEELPSSDETPVDNPLQNDTPNLLLSLLAELWANRDDWYFGVDQLTEFSQNSPNDEFFS